MPHSRGVLEHPWPRSIGGKPIEATGFLGRRGVADWGCGHLCGEYKALLVLRHISAFVERDARPVISTHLHVCARRLPMEDSFGVM